ncbi:hypothetical protein RB653_006098 [Dictyostelium firmibasis]|uniref:F-box domain-containing protein n=1 Tax=Dictyostelium firmibasis TaxID=79012 RepID=A0AAN7UAR3_9MYCE
MAEEGALTICPSNRVITGSDLLNFNEKIDNENFKPELLKRTDLKLSTSNGFKVSNVLTKEECLHFIEESERKGYVSIEKEFPTRYRNNLRYLGKSDKLSDILWERLEPILRESDLEGVRPYGFDQKGVWIPIGIDNCFTFSKYLPGSRFKPHYDAVFADNPDRRSIYTIQIYLNDGFKGGNTNFFTSDNPLLVDKHVLEDSIVPETGSAIIFNHDTLHEGGEVEDGIKYIIRVDMMFLRIDKSLDEISAKEKEEMVLAKKTFFNADSMEKDEKDLETAISLYVKAQMLLTGYPSIDSITQKIKNMNISSTSSLKKRPVSTLDNIPEVELFNVLVLLEPIDLGRLRVASKYFATIVSKDSLWKRIYIRDFSMESFNLEKNSVINIKVNSTRKNIVKSKRFKQFKSDVKRWMLTYQNIYTFYENNEISIIDMGSERVKIGRSNSEITTSFLQRVGIRQEYQPHYVMSSMDRYKWVVGLNATPTNSNSLIGVNSGKFLQNEPFKELVKYSIEKTIKRFRPNAPILLIVNPLNYAGADGGDYLSKIRRYLPNELVLFRNGGLLALQSHGLKSGLVLMLGTSTSVLAAFHNGEQVDANYLSIIGRDLIDEAKSQRVSSGPDAPIKKSLFVPYESYEIIFKDTWLKHTKVSQNFEHEQNNTPAHLQYITKIPELYFKPQFSQKTKHCPSIINSITSFINQMEVHPIFKNSLDDLSKLVLTGGFSIIPGLPERIKKELEPNYTTQILCSDDTFYDQIKGARIDLNLTESLHDRYQKV